MYEIRFTDLGLKDYKATWDIQQHIQQKLVQQKVSGNNSLHHQYLIFVEHPHVFTLGKSGKENNLLVNPDFLHTINAAYYKTDRGGDITYHGPGQIVGYPVFDLGLLHIGIRDYIHNLEESIILTLQEFGIKAGRLKGATGVWVDSENIIPSRKICAIGVKVSRGITMHGFALNVSTNLSYFSYIHPCGFTDKKATSMEEELKTQVGSDDVKRILLNKLSGVFNVKFIDTPHSFAS